ncbi:MAG: 7-cyano-7-deazaguanine synthase [Thermoguttaceae bacterium]
MHLSSDPATIGALASGGLDSCVLVAHLLQQGRGVQPFYVRCGLVWEPEELDALQAFLQAIASPGLQELIVFDLPLADLYADHWSLSGRGAPDADSADDAVYLPGRNALLTIKPAIWCAMHNIDQLALAILAGNPFADATDAFFTELEAMLATAAGSPIAILRPFAKLTKPQVIELGRGLPLELTFSCIAPRDGQPCGQCNKCAERQRAFRSVGIVDPTRYATPALVPSPIGTPRVSPLPWGER